MGPIISSFINRTIIVRSLFKDYGSGVLKVEPISLKNAIIHKGYKKIRNKVYKEISCALKNNHRAEAVMLATNYINESYDIPPNLAEKINSALIELQNRRLSRNSQKRIIKRNLRFPWFVSL